jgi:hypothetical protein
MIQRYDIDDSGIWEEDTGDWCKSEDVDQLEKQNKQLLDALNKLDDIFNVDKKGSIFDARKIITDTLNSITGKKSGAL